jgi:hypothetical protein
MLECYAHDHLMMHYVIHRWKKIVELKMLINDQLHVFHRVYMLIQYDDVLDHIYVLIRDMINQLMDRQVRYIPKKLIVGIMLLK